MRFFPKSDYFETFPLAVYICDKKGLIKYYNRKAAQVWGREPRINDPDERFCGSFMIYSPEGKFIPKAGIPMAQALQTGKVINNIRVVLERPDGSRVFVRVNISPIKDDDGEILGAVNVFEDITASHNLELDLQEKNRVLQAKTEELEQFAYAASHDLREPLRVASTYIQLLLHKSNGTLDETLKNYADIAIRSLARANQLIHDLLTYNRINGTPAECRDDVDLNQALQEALMNLSVEIERRQARIVPERLPVVPADFTQIVLLFQNLLGNAIKFSKAQPQIRVFAEDKPDEIVIGVEDNGIGIPSQYKDKVFQIFQRLNIRSQYPGSGLGLSICKKIVNRHDGNIWFENNLSGGTTFFFSLAKTAKENAGRSDCGGYAQDA